MTSKAARKATPSVTPSKRTAPKKEVITSEDDNDLSCFAVPIGSRGASSMRSASPVVSERSQRSVVSKLKSSARPRVEDETICDICDQPIEGQIMFYRQCKVDAECYNGCVARSKMFRGNRNARDADQSMMENNFDAWKDENLAWKDPETRKVARLNTKQQVESTDMAFTQNANRKSDPFLTRERFKNYLCFWDSKTPDEAYALFDQKFSDSPHYDSDGEPVAEAKGNSFRESIVGSEKKRGTRTLKDVEGGGSVRARSRSPCAQAPAAAGGRGKEESKGKAGKSQPRESEAPGRGKRQKTSATANFLGKFDKDFEQEDNADVKFLEARSTLSDKVKNALKPLNKNGDLDEVKKLVQNLQGNPQLPDMGTIVEDLESTKNDLENLLQSVGKANSGNLSSLESQYSASEPKLVELLKTLLKKKAALEKIKTTSGALSRAGYLASRHQLGKVVKALKGGGYGDHCSKILGEKLYKQCPTMVPETPPTCAGMEKLIDVNPKEFDPKKITIWTPVDGEKNPAVHFADLYEAAKERFETKIGKIDKDLANVENKRWRGQLVRCSGLGDAPAAMIRSIFSAAQSIDHAGAECWVSSAKRDFKRYECHCTSLPGVSAINVPLADEAFLAFEIKGIVNKGMSLQDVEGWFEGLKGKEYLKSNGAVPFVVPANAVVYSPVGWYVVPWFYSPLPRNDKTVATAVHTLQWPLFVKEEIAQLPVKVHNAIHEFNMEYMSQMETQMWTQRMQVFEKYFPKID